MPTSADKLTSESTDQAAQQGISECISQMASEHPDWSNEQCIAACYSMAESAMGRAVKSKSTTVKGV